MAREYTHSPQCAHEGCLERGLFVYKTQRELRDHRRELNQSPWVCLRHRRPNEVLGVDNQQTEKTLQSYTSDLKGIRPERQYQFWNEPGATSGGNGYAFGPGFQAFAEDFPPGTRLIITARVELPQEDE